VIIKKFQAKSENEALELAKSELGDNLVVLNVKKDVKPKGLFSFFRAKLVEITVAKEDDQEIAARNEASDIRGAIASVNKLRTKAEENALPGAASREDNPMVEDMVNRKLDSIQSLLEEKIQKIDDNKGEEELHKNIHKVSAPILKEVEKEKADSKEVNFLKLIYNTMVDNEVSETYANQLIADIEQNMDSDAKMEPILSHIYTKMILKFGKPECLSPSENKQAKLIYFIGPTGVGKTTTLAKIASRLAIVDSKKVAMITADTYRMSAASQLESYANIMHTPFHVIYGAEEMAENYELYKSYDYILVDTAGHSHQNADQLQAMIDLVHALDDVAEKEVYLVLSATTKYRDLISIAEAYKEVSDYRLIFTKLDETSTYGNLYNLRIHTGASLSYVTTGQNVPDDIEKFNPQDTVRKLLGGDSE